MALTKEQQAQLAIAHARWRGDIAAFAFDLFKIELRPKQIEFCEAFQNNKRVTMKGGVGYGKTLSMAICVWWSLFCHNRVKVSIFGPSDAQLKNGIWNELKMLHGMMTPFLMDQWEVHEEEIKRKSKGAECYAVRRLASKENVAAISGIHADNNFIFVDEASGVADEVFAGALQNHLYSDPNPKLILVSNPKLISGFFYDTWNDDAISDQWTKVHGRMADNPRVTQADLDAAAKQWGGRGSNQYIINVEGDFPANDDEGLIPAWQIDKAVENENVTVVEEKPVFWGIDPAGPGRDRTVLVVRHDTKVTMAIERVGLDITQLTYFFRDMYRALPPHEQKRTIITVDANGIGQGLADNLRNFGLPVHHVKSQEKPTKGRDAQGREQFAKLRDQMWWDVKEWIATLNVSIPYNLSLIKELKAPNWAYDGSGRTKVEGKDQMKKRLRMSPDYADALCLTFAADDSRYYGKYNWSQPIRPADLRWAE
ncbi:hypothetical protein JZX86_27675 [Agrobacterium rosae]|uniref:hypothetical protein n=1 Tax=Agrobacterium rosae TaxID=1972867 RepID=UPI0019D33BA2|nr:hypothetical protein [Agrobacterium rosae]MBN7809103.1 hypothetical protein [Agrobacterium rosae]